MREGEKREEGKWVLVGRYLQVSLVLDRVRLDVPDFLRVLLDRTITIHTQKYVEELLVLEAKNIEQSTDSLLK